MTAAITVEHDAACGRPRTKHGPPPKGWIFVRLSRAEGAWYCGAEHAAAAIRATVEPPPITTVTAPPVEPRHDVATCPLCINRHERDHRCGVCNTRPQLARIAEPPQRPYSGRIA
jgi:hypothetical protein